jgi:hypothetical protein
MDFLFLDFDFTYPPIFNACDSKYVVGNLKMFIDCEIWIVWLVDFLVDFLKKSLFLKFDGAQWIFLAFKSRLTLHQNARGGTIALEH